MPARRIGGARRHVIFTQQQESKLHRHAKDTGLTPSEIIRRAMDVYFRAQEYAQERKMGQVRATLNKS